MTLTTLDLVASARRESTPLDRRDFLRICSLAAAAVGLPASAGKAS